MSTEQNLLENLRAFLRAGGNTMPLTRRDASIMVRVLESLEQSRALNQAEPDSQRCAGCRRAFTLDAPARYRRGDELFHENCVPKKRG